MMCSIEELGLTVICTGGTRIRIYIFQKDAEVGSSAISALGLDDVVFTMRLHPTADCYSVTGIAREAAATFRKEFHPPVVTPTGNDETKQ